MNAANDVNEGDHDEVSRPVNRTKFVRVHLAGGVAVELLVPGGVLVQPEKLVADALVVARRYLALAGEPRVTLISTRESLPGDVSWPENGRIRPAKPAAARVTASTSSSRRRVGVRQGNRRDCLCLGRYVCDSHRRGGKSRR